MLFTSHVRADDQGITRFCGQMVRRNEWIGTIQFTKVFLFAGSLQYFAECADRSLSERSNLFHARPFTATLPRMSPPSSAAEQDDPSPPPKCEHRPFSRPRTKCLKYHLHQRHSSHCPSSLMRKKKRNRGHRLKRTSPCERSRTAGHLGIGWTGCDRSWPSRGSVYGHAMNWSLLVLRTKLLRRGGLPARRTTIPWRTLHSSSQRAILGLVSGLPQTRLRTHAIADYEGCHPGATFWLRPPKGTTEMQIVKWRITSSFRSSRRISQRGINGRTVDIQANSKDPHS
jgi:hypothetical protein